MENASNEIVSTYALRGAIVRNVQDVKLGEIEDIVLDSSGQIVYVILLVNIGFMGLNNRYFMVPWEAFHYDLSQEHEPAIILEMDLAIFSTTASRSSLLTSRI